MNTVYTASELSAFGRCPRLWWYCYRAGDRANGIESTIPYLPFLEGRFVHHTLEIYRRTGRMQKANLLKYAAKIEAEYGDAFSDETRKEFWKHVRMAYGACVAYRAMYPGEAKRDWLGIESKVAFTIDGREFAGRIDGAYRDGGITIVDTKFASKAAALQPLSLVLNTQRWFYVVGVHAQYNEWPVRFDLDQIFKTQIRQKKDETEDEFESRLVQVYTHPEGDPLFHRTSLPVESSSIGWLYSLSILPRLELIQNHDAECGVPYLNDTQCVVYQGNPCAFLPACTALLQGRSTQGWDAPACGGLYREKRARHVELEED